MEPQIPPVPPTPKINNSLVFIMSILLIVTVAIAGLFYFQIQKLSKELSQYQTLVSPAPIATTYPTADWKTYTNTKYNFSFKYPSDWEILDRFGGPIMIAPIVDTENVNKTFEENVLEGGYDGGKQLISLLSITQGGGTPSSGQYWEIIKTSIQIDSKTADKYTSTNIKDTPNGKFVKGDINTTVLIQLIDDYVIDYTLMDQRYTQTYDQILSTFKFLE